MAVDFSIASIAKSITHPYIKTKAFLVKNPKAIIPIVFVVFLMCMGVFEHMRANRYLASADDYAHSVGVLTLKDDIDRLNKLTTENNDVAYMCSIGLSGLIGGVNEAYGDQSDDPDSIKSVVERIHEMAQESVPSPTFNSMLQFLPRVSDARVRSQDMKKGLENIVSLTSEDTRSTYCSSLVDVLSEVYFIDSLRTEQGVGALGVGQVNEFKNSVSMAQDALRELAPPKLFTKYHISINDLLNNLRADLSEDENQYQAFSRAIQEDYDQLTTILQELEHMSFELRAKPGQLLLHSAKL